jgi:hypothetical protein
MTLVQARVDPDARRKAADLIEALIPCEITNYAFCDGG